MVLLAIKRSVLSAAKMKRIINFPETSCNLALFALKYSRYANRLGRRGVRRKLLSERTVHRLEGGFRGHARKVASEPESWIMSGVQRISKWNLQSGTIPSRGSRLIRVKETAVVHEAAVTKWETKVVPRNFSPFMQNADSAWRAFFFHKGFPFLIEERGFAGLPWKRGFLHIHT